MKIVILRDTVIEGSPVYASQTYETKDSVAKLLIALGKAKIYEEMQDDALLPLEEMSRAKLIDEAKRQGLKTEPKMTKADLIELISGVEYE
ncbi:hypothetical protein CIG2463D_1467 [Campylobacter iguaniorum]|uniref:hypothetical protein n=1 Tax=Campylobacter iguaniorum TaxID=1244531 RepID=UPI00073A2B65|nr:hypothetical protein [Campylobacter iguaniorum]ALV25032.1 hypothetical protein CIG2463D_1467 [Campylobacter iguaniorum]